jgi:alkylation response protein AidB-like acyl-CoA dehydrogenase
MRSSSISVATAFHGSTCQRIAAAPVLDRYLAPLVKLADRGEAECTRGILGRAGNADRPLPHPHVLWRWLIDRPGVSVSRSKLTVATKMPLLGESDVAMEVTTNAVQLFGGYGYTRDFPVERMMRDAKITQIYEGTNQIQRVVMSRALLR